MNEKNSLLKIKKEQNKALDFLNNEGEYDKKVKKEIIRHIYTLISSYYHHKILTYHLTFIKFLFYSLNKLLLNYAKQKKRIEDKMISFWKMIK